MTDLKQILLKNFGEGVDFLITKDKERLRAQGHYASGRLERSLRSQEYFQNGHLVSDFYTRDYGIDLDTGLRPNQIKYTRQDLLEWAKIIMPSSSDFNINSFVHFTMRKHRIEGTPTLASLRFSSTGERTKWIQRGNELLDKDFDKLFKFSIWFLSYLDGLTDGE